MKPVRPWSFWPWRRKRQAPHATLLALAGAVLDCREAFPRNVAFCVSMDPDHGLVSVTVMLSCGEAADAIFGLDELESVPERMGLLLVHLMSHARQCAHTVIDIGPIEIRIPGSVEGN